MLLPAAPVGLAALSSAHAQIVYTNASNLTFQAGAAATFYIGSSSQPDHVTYESAANSNFRRGAGYTFYMAFQGGSSAQPYAWTPNYQSSPQILTNAVSPGLATLITAGTVISATPPSSSVWGPNPYTFLSSSNYVGQTQWTPGTTGYLALKLNNGTDFGWVQATYNLDQTLTIIDFAYEASGGAIQAGDTGISSVPEPASYALIAGLLAGSVALYLRRQQPKAAA
jgi:hypothetical protein